MDYQPNPNPGYQGPNMAPPPLPVAPQPNYQAPPPLYGGGFPPPPPPAGSNGVATAAMVLGIVALALTLFMGSVPFVTILPLALAIVGLVLSINARKKFPGDSKATAGLILSIIALALSGIMFAACTIYATCTICSTCVACTDLIYYY